MSQSQPFAQIRILDYEFWTGDGRLESVSVELGEDERSSTCQFRFYDPGLKIASYLFQLSQASGGITFPSDLLQDPSTAGSAPAPSPVPLPVPVPVPTPTPGGGTPAPAPVPTPTPQAGPAGTAGKTATGIFLSNAENGLKNDALAKKIIEYCRAMGVNDIHHQAYILATTQHESVMGVYSEEIASGAAYEGRADLGNTQPGDGVRFKG